MRIFSYVKPLNLSEKILLAIPLPSSRKIISIFGKVSVFFTFLYLPLFSRGPYYLPLLFTFSPRTSKVKFFFHFCVLFLFDQNWLSQHKERKQTCPREGKKLKNWRGKKLRQNERHYVEPCTYSLPACLSFYLSVCLSVCHSSRSFNSFHQMIHSFCTREKEYIRYNRKYNHSGLTVELLCISDRYTMVWNKQEMRRKYWATHLSVRSFTPSLVGK